MCLFYCSFKSVDLYLRVIKIDYKAFPAIDYLSFYLVNCVLADIYGYAWSRNYGPFLHKVYRCEWLPANRSVKNFRKIIKLILTNSSFPQNGRKFMFVNCRYLSFILIPEFWGWAITERLSFLTLLPWGVFKTRRVLGPNH